MDSSNPLGLFGKRFGYYLALAKTLDKILQPKSVLDVGCNTGAFVKAFHRLGIKACGVDISQQAVSTAPSDLRGHYSTNKSDYCQNILTLVTFQELPLGQKDLC